ncbi:MULTISPECIES: UDP-N-acetylmuramate dehydrogenase [Thermodesulfobacterium]|jgi:UDP-N-acetylmuramate dehydrogenase|uniref:UDP-N-acetylenolpyruvoylglucosamine reductase n=1 Tax=Thermodesulfobacterium commune TaxID=1741 RepID=A0A117LCD9_9BACT|nr:UDP-N-acetylmuramate dehydrogenase [Thermodesulfobacterium sp.]KUJ97958.1 MAG: UDP-N-acetylenolpyruvoylglucosamine reductase [Thermodesulfobacterium sp. 37_54]KUK19671.1 MAG: UDP-N-acetylenolpyruvoylglucosamine reductase [Thermodesulfobacterium commune]KUK38215.1 MAG: UDP-N-acetylenolpyruvoylglucosamine reductase [Thermodesulfobacterium commune]MBZ4682291.1 murB [Thermodesulfobacterium sp.]MDK2861365.1 UDP-N-acetylmuramate dehydrogenase [Thermodesulfobacterium sp.]
MRQEIREFLEENKIFYLENEPLASYTTIKIGGPCDLLVFPKEKEVLVKLLEFLENTGTPFYILGGGSNLLVADEGFKGVVISLKRLKGIEVLSEGKDEVVLKVKAGTGVNELISLCLKKGFSGMEFLAGVPATIGGTVRMNAGAFGRSISQVVKKVLLYHKGDLVYCEVSEEDWSYRRFKKEGVILEADLKLEKSEKEVVKRKVLEVLNKRRLTQPISKRTFGSVFKNPPCYYAGQLIEACGLKGYKVGEAEISKKHANFIVNLGRAKAKEVLELMKLAQKKVWEKFRVKLDPEVKFLGVKDEEIF